MIKSIIKEIFIMLLLCAAVVLILAVVFYEYNPINKEIPTTLKYEMPSELANVKEELNKELITKEEQIIKTYEITESELKLYTKVNYDKGKADPFAKYSETPSGNVITGGSTSGNTNTNSTGSFFENGSTK